MAGSEVLLVPDGDGSRGGCSGNSSFVVCEDSSGVGVAALDVEKIIASR